MILILPSTDSLAIIGEETSIGRTRFSIFLLLDPPLMSTLTSSSTSRDKIEISDWIELALVETDVTFFLACSEIVEMLDWMEFSLVMTLLGRTPSSFNWAMVFVAMCLPWYYNKRKDNTVFLLVNNRFTTFRIDWNSIDKGQMESQK